MASVDYIRNAAFCLFGIFVSGVNGEEIMSSGIEPGFIIAGIAGVVVLTIAVAICIDKRVHVDLMDRGPPFWTRSLYFRPEFGGGFTATSEGIDNMTQFHVKRTRLGRAVTDGARWDVGFTQGKHVFEVLWPIVRNRGAYSSIGVGTIDVPLKKQGRLSLVGHHSQSWGLDLSSRKILNANKFVGSFPREVPDKFYMYLDIDAGKIGFGEDVKEFGRASLFYGNLINNIRVDKVKPLYFMVGSCAPMEEVVVFYMGSAVPAGGFDLIPPEQPPQVVVIPQNQPGSEGAPSPPQVIMPQTN